MRCAVPSILCAGLILTALATATPGQAQPAAPACTAPAGRWQSLICADPALREADRRLRAAERDAASATARPASFAIRAAAWQRAIDAQRPPGGMTAEAWLASAHDLRIEALAEQTRQDHAVRQAGGERPIPQPAGLEEQCFSDALRNCRVRAAGFRSSEDGTRRLLWQEQAGEASDGSWRAGIVVLAAVGNGWAPIAWAFEHARYGQLALTETRAGLLLTVAGGSGGEEGNADLVYRWEDVHPRAPHYRPEDSGWRQIDAEDWIEALSALLPPDHRVREPVDYDFARMTARIRLWRSGDRYCCPTGGTARVSLRVEGNRLVLGEGVIDPFGTPVELAGRTAACPAERAAYRLNMAAGFSAELRWVGSPPASSTSELLLRLHAAESRRDYWFRFVAAPGAVGLHLVPVAPPRTDPAGVRDLAVTGRLRPLLQVLPLRRDLMVLPEAPRYGAEAPQHLLTPGLSQAMHHGLLPQQAGRPGASEPMPPGPWTLDGCR